MSSHGFRLPCSVFPGFFLWQDQAGLCAGRAAPSSSDSLFCLANRGSVMMLMLMLMPMQEARGGGRARTQAGDATADTQQPRWSPALRPSGSPAN